MSLLLSLQPAEQEAAAPLAYAARPAGRRYRSVLRAFALFSPLIFGLAGWIWGPAAWTTTQALYWQDRCLHHRWPDGAVALDSATLIGSPRSGLWPGCWDRIKVGNPQADYQGLTFLHRRAAPGMSARLVAVELFRHHPEFHNAVNPATLSDDFVPLPSPPTLNQDIYLQARVQPIGNFRTPPAVRSPSPPPAPPPPVSRTWAFFGDYNCVRLKNSDHLRLFAGIPDPNDAARFTIPYEWNGQPGVIAGSIDATDAVRFLPESGPLILESFEQRKFPLLSSKLSGG